MREVEAARATEAWWQAALRSPVAVIQMGETLLFGGIAAFGILGRHPIVALVGAGLLMGKAITNLLPPGVTYQRRAWIGYAGGALFFGLALLAHSILNAGG
jgi:hypothetical protein